MKRTPLVRKTPLKRSGPVKARRATPRRRTAPRWDTEDWHYGNLILMARSGSVCERCGKNCGPFERHHRKRRRDGGDRLSNILLLGRGCHAWVTEHPALARRYGWIVSVNRDPATVPVLHKSQTWVMLDDGGGMVGVFDVEDAHEIPET